MADTFRAAFSAKGWPVDIREHYLPSSYFMYSLALARYYIWTRFPNSKEIALDEPRQKLFDAALEMLKSPTLPTFDPDYSDDPELSGDTSLTAYDDAALTLPWQRILPQPFACGFAHPYIYDTQLSSK